MADCTLNQPLREPACARAAAARCLADKLTARARELLSSCEAECDCSAMLLRQARELRLLAQVGSSGFLRAVAEARLISF